MKESHERDLRGGRPDLRATLARDLARHGRREDGAKTFWRSLGVLGSVGWPIVLLAVGGATAGHWLDGRYGTGIGLTLLLLVLGTAAGAAVAWHVLRQER